MRVSRSDHDVCAKLAVRPGKPDSHRCGARTRDAHRAPLNAADSRFSVRLFIGFDLAFYRWNSRFEATDLDGHEGGLISVPLAVGNRVRGSGKDTVGTAADAAVPTSGFTRSIKA
jgi:hypothetical protein